MNGMAFTFVLLFLVIAMIFVLSRALQWPASGVILLRDGGESPLDEQRERLAISQYRDSFRLVIAAGIVGLGLWALAVSSLLFQWRVSSITQVISVVAAAGDSALFGYFVRVWRECRAYAKR